jgi:hypothetical protein
LSWASCKPPWFFLFGGRAREAQKKDPIVFDTYAREIVDRIGYDFSKIEGTLTESLQMTWAIPAYNFDATIRTFLASHKDALVVNIGAGLDTAFQRIDNGTVRWVNIDLPDVVSVRQKLLPDSERELTIGKSVFDYTWMDDISTQAKGRALNADRFRGSVLLRQKPTQEPVPEARGCLPLGSSRVRLLLETFVMDGESGCHKRRLGYIRDH